MVNSNLVLVTILLLSIFSTLVTINPARADVSAPGPIPAGQLPPTTPSNPSTPTSTTPQTVPIAPNTSYAVNQVKSGYVVSDSLTNETRTQQQLAANSGYWFYGGDAPSVHAPYTFFRNTTGLYIGVKAPANGTWAGYYAVTQNTTAMLFHAVVSTPYHTIPSNNNWFENGIYVQNGTGNVSYIVCNAVTSKLGTQWIVSSAKGGSVNANVFTNLWWSPMDQTQPLTEDCTIITNGHNYLEVYLNGTKVYENHSMDLNYINPMVAFLEPQSNYNGALINGTYRDFYATTSENVTVANTPSGAKTVEIVKPTSACYGTVLASAPVDSSGKALLGIGQYHMPLGAFIQVYDANGNEIASTSNQVNIFGGDVYSANQLSSSTTPGNTSNTAQCIGTVPTGLTATAFSPSQINLSWTAPSGISSLPTGYKIERSTDSGSTWSTIIPNTGSTATTYSDTGLAASTTYTYRVSAVYVNSSSPPSNTASATTRCSACQLTVIAENSTNTSIQGLYTTLTNQTTGQVLASGFTPTTFILNSGTQYGVTVYNYPPNVFNHWLDNNSTANPRQISITSNTPITAWFNNGQPPPVAPQPPTGLTATSMSTSQINLSWVSPSNNGGSAITGYKIERSTDAGTTWSITQSNTGSTATTYSDTGLAASTTYTYRVSAINSAGPSQPSNTASATTNTPPPPAGITLNSIQSTSGTVSTSNQITLTNFSAGSGNDRLLVVGISANKINAISVTFGGVPLTQKVMSFFNNDVELWYLKNPTGTGNIVVTMGGSTQAVVGAYSFSGVNQTSPLPTSVANHNIVASSPTISLTTQYQKSWVLDLPSIYGGSTLGSPTCTQQWNINMPNTITGASSSTITQSPGSVTCNWTASSGDLWDDVAVELRSD